MQTTLERNSDQTNPSAEKKLIILSECWCEFYAGLCHTHEKWYGDNLEWIFRTVKFLIALHPITIVTKMWPWNVDSIKTILFSALPSGVPVNSCCNLNLKGYEYHVYTHTYIKQTGTAKHQKILKSNSYALSAHIELCSTNKFRTNCK